MVNCIADTRILRRNIISSIFQTLPPSKQGVVCVGGINRTMLQGKTTLWYNSSAMLVCEYVGQLVMYMRMMEIFEDVLVVMK